MSMIPTMSVLLVSQRLSLKVQELFLFQNNSTFPSVASIFILRNDNNSIIGDLMLQSTKTCLEQIKFITEGFWEAH